MKWVYLVLCYLVPHFMIEFVFLVYFLKGMIEADSKYFILYDVCAVLGMTVMIGVNCWAAYKYLSILKMGEKVYMNVFKQINAVFIVINVVAGLILAVIFGEYFTRLVRIISYLWDAVCSLF